MSRDRQARRSLRWLVPVAILMVLVVSLYVVVDQRTVVPGVSARLYPIHYRESIERMADRYGVDPYLVAAVARAESGFDPNVVSRAGAVGLMQVMPATAAWVVGLDTWQGRADPELTDADDSLELGACYLAFLLKYFAGDRLAAVAAYNAGQGVVGRWVAAAGADGFGLADIVFPETRAFVQRVEESLELYRRVHPDIFGRLGATA